MTALPRRTLAVLAMAVAVLSTGVAATPVGGPAAAAARVTVANEFGRAEADLTYSTAITVSGSGFQSVSGGFGGIYVLFGWVSGGAWQPSRGGATGDTYRYVPDAEGASNAGFQRFVSFPGGETADSANGGVIAADGSWRVSMYVPGPVFTALDRSGAQVSVDCRQVTCGVITVGAHGVVSAANETFTPVSFTQVFGSAPADAPAPAPAASAGTGGRTTSSGSGAPSTGSAPPPAAAGGEAPAEGEVPADTGAPAAPGVLVDPATAVAGRVLSFTASGLLPGEQVLATLDDGLVSVGPLPVTDQGTVSGLLELPETMAGGNHRLRLTGTSTGGLPELTFAVRSDAGALTVPAASTTEADRPSTAAVAFVAAAAAVLLVVVTARVTRRRTGRRVLAAAGASS